MYFLIIKLYMCVCVRAHLHTLQLTQIYNIITKIKIRHTISIMRERDIRDLCCLISK